MDNQNVPPVSASASDVQSANPPQNPGGPITAASVMPSIIPEEEKIPETTPSAPLTLDASGSVVEAAPAVPAAAPIPTLETPAAPGLGTVATDTVLDQGAVAPAPTITPPAPTPMPILETTPPTTLIETSTMPETPLPGEKPSTMAMGAMGDTTASVAQAAAAAELSKPVNPAATAMAVAEMPSPVAPTMPAVTPAATAVPPVTAPVAPTMPAVTATPIPATPPVAAVTGSNVPQENPDIHV